jgi:hypothetical protein
MTNNPNRILSDNQLAAGLLINLVFMRFLYEDWLGLKIRRERKAKKLLNFSIIKRLL